MENYNIYQDVSTRAGGDIYVGVVGPVRTGKSTFIKRFMETLVLPNAKESERSEMVDELPQSAAGKTVMTTEPKFVPAKAAKITLSKGVEASVRLVDCVGFAVEGANGFEEDGSPRFVNTPWSEEAMPFEQAAAVGTEKVIREHSTIGIMVTTDGSITDISRVAYEKAEERAVRELKALKKPFVILLNCRDAVKAEPLKKALESKYEAPVVALNVEKMQEEDLLFLMQKVLLEFPVLQIDVKIPMWLRALGCENTTVATLLNKIKTATEQIERMRDCFTLESLFDESEDFLNPGEIYMDLGTGRTELKIDAKPSVFYRVLSEECGENIDDDLSLMRYVRSLSVSKNTFDKVQIALQEAEEMGYGIVYPTEEEFLLQKPQLVKKSAGYGVHFRATAASYHIVKVDVGGDVCPIIGTKEQGESFVTDTLQLYDEGIEKVWTTNIFGKTLRALVADELSKKADGMPVEVRKKMRRAVSRIVNDGKGNLICFVF